MKKLFLTLMVALLCSAAQAITMPKHIYVASQDGNIVKVYNVQAKETMFVNGFLRDIGVDKGGNVYVLVCSTENGWGNYYVYKNCSPQIYLSLIEDQGGIYSSAAMKVKGNDVVVAAVQSLGFNSKGYQSRMAGYVNGQRVFLTGYDRRGLKYDNFMGYKKIVGKNIVGYGQENNSGNPQGDHLSCVCHVDDVDYCNGAVYTTGWGEREYSENIGTTKYYFVRRCPRVWKNGVEVVKQYENKTGAAWNISVFNRNGKEYIFTSGHKGSVACAWEHNADLFTADYYYYPGVIKEATFPETGDTDAPNFGRAFLGLGNTNLKVIEVYSMSDNRLLHKRMFGMNGDISDIVAGKDGFYAIVTDSYKTVEIHCWRKYSGTTFGEEQAFVCRLPGNLGLKNPMLAVAE